MLRRGSTTIEVREDVCGAYEILVFDPMYLADEGRPATAARIGTVSDDWQGVLLKSLIGSTRIVDMFSGERLPRIF
jgi:hydrogenase expression/formation protein HypE